MSRTNKCIGVFLGVLWVCALCGAAVKFAVDIHESFAPATRCEGAKQ